MLIDDPTEAQWTELWSNCLNNPGDMDHLNKYPYMNIRPTANVLYPSLRRGPFRVWLIQAGEQIIGFLNYGNVVPHQPNAFGVAIGKQFVGQGYARQALQEFIERRAELGIEEINGYCHPDNAAIRRVMELCGFEKVSHADPHPALKYTR